MVYPAGVPEGGGCRGRESATEEAKKIEERIFGDWVFFLLLLFLFSSSHAWILDIELVIKEIW